MRVDGDGVAVYNIDSAVLPRLNEFGQTAWKVVLVRIQPRNPSPLGARQRPIETVRLSEVAIRDPFDLVCETAKDVQCLVVRASVLDDVLDAQTGLPHHGLDAVRDEPPIAK